MIFTRLESRICLDEGFRAKPYLDTVGVATIGYGSIRYPGNVAVTLNDAAIDEFTARELMRGELFRSCVDAETLFPRFHEMDHVRQEVLVNMAYNLGKAGLGGFTNMLEAADRLDYSAMADHAMDSKWYGQVGDRGKRLCAALRSGSWV